jgi:peptide/nickel transport system substrate-binding protein
MSQPGDQGNFNNWHPNNVYVGDWMYDDAAMYSDSNQEYVGFVVSDWTVNAESAKLTVSPHHTWHDGDQVTAEDLRMWWDMQTVFTPKEEMDFIADWSIEDSSTVSFRFKQQSNPRVIRRALLNPGEAINTKVGGPYQPFVERIRDATTDTERQSITQDLRDFTIDSVDDVVGNGPWRLTNRDTQGLQFELYSDYDNGHITAESFNFDEFRLEFLSNTQKKVLALSQGEIDYWVKTHPTQTQLDQQPDAVVWNKVPIYNGYGLLPNFNREPYDDRRVRQALLLVINSNVLAKNTSGAYQRLPIENPVGISTYRIEDFIDDSQRYDQYDSDAERAATLLRDAGFTKDGEFWRRPNGDRFEPEIIEGRGGQWISIASNVVDQLKQFGIRATLQKLESTQVYGSIVPNSNFDLLSDWWNKGWFNGGHPYALMRENFVGYHAQQDTVQGQNFPTEFEVPMPVGDTDGELNTVTPKPLFEELSRAQSIEKEKNIIQQLAWVYNQHLPTIPLTEEHDINLFSNSEFDYPPVDEYPVNQGDPQKWVQRVEPVVNTN